MWRTLVELAVAIGVLAATSGIGAEPGVGLEANGVSSVTGLSQPLAGEMRYLGDAARFTECRTGESYPIAMEGEYLTLEREYLALVSEPGAPLYVTFDGAIVARPRMEGEGDEPAVVVTRFIHLWPDERCERARADASLSNTYWRIVRLGDEAVTAAPGQREPHLLLRGSEDGPSFAATVGCNQHGGQFTVDGSAIAFGPVAATMMACPPPLDELEPKLGAALAAARSWRILGNTMELFDEVGVPVALFEAVYL